MLSGAIRRFKKESYVNLELADVTEMKYAAAEFDTVNVANSLHCFPDLKTAIKEIHRVLKSQGTFCGNVLLYPKEQGLLNRLSKKINEWGIKKGILYTPYYESEIRQILQDQGFTIVYTKIGGNCFDFVAKK